jgi:hypothetical protein
MKKLLLLVLAVGVVALGWWWYARRSAPPDLPFAAASSPAMDFARLEHELPLTADHRRRLMPAHLKALSQEEVDQVYGRLTAGPIPDGPFEGDLFFARGVDGDSRLAEIVGGRLKGLLGDAAVHNLEFLGRTLWKGKVFYRDQRLLRNRIEDLTVLTPILGGNSDGIEKITVGGRDAWLLFPARLYCGQSLLDGRRESIIIDYALSDELPGYRDMPDRLAARNGLRIRDEIRMIRPGFYLGRAYMNRVFALNFTLYRESEAEASSPAPVTEDCWAGTQARAGAE